MRDENSYFARYKQCLYFARLQVDLLDKVENGELNSAADFSGDNRPVFDAQRQLCFAEAAVNNLFRAACFLTCFVVPASAATKILGAPRGLVRTLGDLIAVDPTAAMQSIYQQFVGSFDYGAGPEKGSDSSHQASDAESLSNLIRLYPSLWSVAQPSTSRNLINTRQIDFSATQCRVWMEQLSELGQLVVNLETES